MLECTAENDLVLLRRSFVSDIARECTPRTLRNLTQTENTTEQLKTLTREDDAVRRTAQYMYDVLALVDQFPLYRSARR